MGTRARWTLLAIGLTACGTEPIDLSIDVRTDFAPGLEFVSARIVRGPQSDGGQPDAAVA